MNTQKLLDQHPALLAFLPMLYVAWADGIMTPSEASFIQEKIQSFSWLNEGEKKILLSWSTPNQAPNGTQLQDWLTIIKTHKGQANENRKPSLTDLGCEMAEISANGIDARWFNPDAYKRLSELEKEIGCLHIDAYRTTLGLEEHQTKTEKPSFDVAKMMAILDGTHLELRRKVRQVLSDPVFAYREYETKEEYREQCLEWCKILAKQGFGASAFPESCGGKDDIGEYLAIFETLGSHDLSLLIKFGVQFGLFGGSILALGTEVHHQKYLKDVGTLELAGCFAMTETGHGSNVREIETTATYDIDKQEFIIHTPHAGARKDYIGNAAMHGEMATVFAQLYTKGECHGVHAFLVPIRDKDRNVLPNITALDCGKKLGLNGVDNGRLLFDQVRVPHENLLNRFADVALDGTYSSPIENPSKRFFTMLGTLVGGRVGVPFGGLSAAKSGLVTAVKYALKRRQFGPEPGKEICIMDYQTHQKRLMPLVANAYAIDFALTYLMKRFVNSTEEDSREIETLAAGLKSFATWNTTHTLQTCREACGGQGYLAVNRFADLKADTDIFTTFEGDNTVLMQLVAKGLLSDFKREFNNLNMRTIVKYLSEKVSANLTEWNVFFTRNTSRQHLRDSEFHLESFQHRTRSLLFEVANSLKGRIDKGMDPFDAFLRCQNRFIDLAHAHIEGIVVEQFILAINELEDEAIKTSLKRLCDLFALSHMEKHQGWYLEEGYFSGVKTKAIREEINLLNLEVRQEVEALVDAFGIPDSCVAVIN